MFALLPSCHSRLENAFLIYITQLTQDMKDNKKLNNKHIKMQMTQTSFKTCDCNKGCTIQLCSKMY